VVHAAHHEVRSFAEAGFRDPQPETPLVTPEPEPLPPAPSQVPEQPVEPVYASAGTTPALARRVPQSSLAPQMRNGSVAPVLPGEAASSPAPEHARSLLSAYRTGLTLGRSGIMDSSGLTPDRYGAPPDERPASGEPA